MRGIVVSLRRTQSIPFVVKDNSTIGEYREFTVGNSMRLAFIYLDGRSNVGYYDAIGWFRDSFGDLPTTYLGISIGLCKNWLLLWLLPMAAFRSRRPQFLLILGHFYLLRRRISLQVVRVLTWFLIPRVALYVTPSF